MFALHQIQTRPLLLNTILSPKNLPSSLLLIKMSSSWSCKICTFINPPSQTPTCQICLSSQPPSSSLSSSSLSPQWPCKSCTFLNPYRNSTCQICGARSSSSALSLLDEEIDDAELEEVGGSDIGSVFLPLKGCTNILKSCSNKGKDLSEPSGLIGLRKNGKRKIMDEEEGEGDDSGVKSDDATKDKSVTERKGNFLKIMTYNVWFREDLELYRRMSALGELIQLHSPDIICFQEVTSDIYDIFKGTSWWKTYSCSVPRDKASTSAYFCMQLSRLPVRSFKCNSFHNSIMGRELCLAEVEVQPGRTIVVATSHLESPCPGPPKWDQMFSKERVEQANETIKFLKSYKNVIFCGDMNWDDKLDGQFPLSDGWFDAWSQMKPGDAGYTYDTKSNKMLTGNRTLQKRLDRFLCKLEDFAANEICMIGMDAIPGLTYYKEKKLKKEVKKLELPVLPSDHYGLLLTIGLD
ncbi:hypothetical protein LIER_16660 [Lithospermum erythrorhizon]|uniref:RanBP2-type domain-containing protein n=1 Tax=Lithospermum erythrorhizon TaxID=34254 RepID=A0AAV3Q923_LITER